VQRTSELDETTRQEIGDLVTEALAAIPREGNWQRLVALIIVQGLSEMGLVPERPFTEVQVDRLAAFVADYLWPAQIGVMILNDITAQDSSQ